MDLKQFLTKGSAEDYDRLAKTTAEFLSGSAELEEKEDQGYIFSYGFYPETARYAFQEWKGMKEDNVYIASFPKSGTNWTYEVVRYLLYMHDEERFKIAKSMPLFMMNLSMSGSSKYNILDQIPLQRNLLRTHMPPALCNLEKVKQKRGKIIVVIRNPKDQAVSWFHFTKKPHLKDKPFAKDWNQFLDDYMAGKHHLWTKEGQWYPDRILDWWKYRDDKDFLFIHFEDMKKNLQKEIRRMASFLEVQVTEKMVNNIARFCSFDYMYGQMPEHMKMFTRKGKVGGWKNWFTVAQSEKMDKLIAEKLRGSGVEFIYEL